MKTCPYCAEEIQDAAIKCRYCHSDLSVPPPAASSSSTTAPAGGDTTSTTSTTSGVPATSPASDAAAPTPELEPAPAATPSADPGSVHYTHSGYRYVLGYGADFFGIWDRQAPTTPADRFPRTDEGWRQAWTRFATLEPRHVPVPEGGGATTPSPSQPGLVTPDPSDIEALQYTHSGSRYLLGYGQTFFGIWDRQTPAVPVEKFPRDDAGWAAAWRRYTQIEQHYAEVGTTSPSSSGPGPTGF